VVFRWLNIGVSKFGSIRFLPEKTAKPKKKEKKNRFIFCLVFSVNFLSVLSVYWFF
jgi:membrane protein insertase Oxa1/YidC/SpoIIIJ